MATMSYRMIVSYSNEKQAYIARAPELESCSAEGATRAEAVARLEEEITAQVANMESQGIEVPAPIELLEELDGKLTLNVTSSLHRDLAFLAKAENVDVETLVIEFLARGVSQRWGGGRGQRPRGEGGPRRTDGTGSRYHNIMENRADFIEYVRSLEKTGQGGGGNRGPGGQGGGGGRGPRGRR